MIHFFDEDERVPQYQYRYKKDRIDNENIEIYQKTSFDRHSNEVVSWISFLKGKVALAPRSLTSWQGLLHKWVLSDVAAVGTTKHFQYTEH